MAGNIRSAGGTLAAVALFALGPSDAALAQSTSWTGGTSAWETPGNWSGSAEPTATHNVFINGAGTAPIVTLSGELARTLELGTGGSQTGTLTIDGGSLSLTTGQNINPSASIGASGTGHLTIQGGGSFTSGSSYVGLDPGSNGTATVTGANSLWTVRDFGYFDVGSSGAGSLAVLAGGRVNASQTSYFSIGNDNGATGTVTVSGNGSRLDGGSNTYVAGAAGSTGTLTVSGTGALYAGQLVYVGVSATPYTAGIGPLDAKGTLRIEDGATGSATSMNVGYGASAANTAEGHLEISGAGSALTLVGTLRLGQNDGPAMAASGTLLVEAGGRLSGGSGVIGQSAGAIGIATVTGANSLWSNTGGTVTVGQGGKGTLEIADGGSVTSNQGAMSTEAGSIAELTITGAGSNWTTVSGFVTGASGSPGQAGSATISILDGGMLSLGGGPSTSDFRAYKTTVITVDGAGSTFIAKPNSFGTIGDFVLGAAGTGNSITVTEGGAFKVGRADLTTTAASTVTVSVSGADSLWQSTGLKVGGAGTAGFTLDDEATAETGTTEVVIDGTNLLAPKLTVSNQAEFTSLGSVRIGKAGKGELLVASGGTLQSSFLFVGEDAGSSGVMTVSGAGSTVTTTTSLVIGFNGTGTLLVEAGGDVVSKGSSSVNHGSARVTGAGSTWTFPHDPPSFVTLSVGPDGTLTVDSGGAIDMGHTYSGLSISGAMVLRDAGSRIDTNVFIADGDATLQGHAQILDGGVLSTDFSVIGTGGIVNNVLKQGNGKVTVDGAGSQWLVAETLDVGQHGSGVLVVSGGGKVSAVDGYIGSFNMAGRGDGIATVTGTGSLWSNSGALRVGDYGDGTLEVTAGGKVTSGNGHVGARAGSTGTATIAGVGSLWEITGALAIANAGTGTLTLENSGAVTVTGSTSIGALGKLAFGDGGAAGTLTTSGISNAGIISFNNTGSVTLAAPISGSGTLDKAGSGTAILAGASTYSGATSVSGGHLYVNGSLGSSTVTVGSGATLGGNGSIFSAMISSGGSLAPGNSIDTLTVGSVIFASGAYFDVELAPTEGDRLVVNGPATIDSGAIVRAAVGPGSYAPGTAYLILDAQTRVGGFGSVVDNSAFLDFELDQTFDQNQVWLRVASMADFATAAETPNQVATADAAQSLGNGNPIFGALAVLPADDARDAFDQLSGEIYASSQRALLDDSRYPREAALDRVDAAFAALARLESDRKGHIWARAYGGLGEVEGDGNAGAFTTSSSGLLVGMDGLVADDFLLGVEFGAGTTALSLSERSSHADFSSYHMGLYGAARVDALTLKFGGIVTRYMLDVARTPDFPGFSDETAADADSVTGQLFAELAYALDAGNLRFEPFGRLALIRTGSFAYSESGGASALSGSTTDLDATIITAGLRGSSEFTLGDDLVVQARATVGLERRIADKPAALHQFAGGDAFAVTGAPAAETSLMFEAGMSADIATGVNLDLSYSARLGDSGSSHAAMATITGHF